MISNAIHAHAVECENRDFFTDHNVFEKPVERDASGYVRWISIRRLRPGSDPSKTDTQCTLADDKEQQFCLQVHQRYQG